ncbi:unnamed protein product, partial [marine sediment metagenome]
VLGKRRKRLRSSYMSLMGQRFSRILRPKDEGAVFYELVSRGTSEQDFSNKVKADKETLRRKKSFDGKAATDCVLS